MTTFRTIDDLDVAGKRVLVRADLNVPMKGGKVTNTTRIDRTVPTLLELADKGAKVIVMSHLGRPKGQKNPEFSLKPVADALADATGRPVAFAPDCVGPEAKAVVDAMKDGDLAMLENLRFYPEEEKNGQEFAKQLAENGDILISDAFSTAHRAHASVEALARLIPSAAGRLMQEELEALESALENPQRPAAAVVGGAKISTKLDVLGNLVEKVDQLIIGGAMANTFLAAKGYDMGASLYERDLLETAREILEAANAAGSAVLLPMDGVVTTEFKAHADRRVAEVDQIKPNEMMLDCGPETVDRLADAIAAARTLVWNGPLGAFETPPFDTATVEAARYAAQRCKDHGLTAVAGGGDTVAALNQAGVADEFTFVSTAGGAFLEWLEGKALPGVEALKA